MDLGLTDRVAVILAASKGLGRACAEALAREGCRLAVCARGKESLENTAQEIRDATGRPVFARSVDVESDSERDAFIQSVEKEYGRIDVLVVNSGGPPPGAAMDLDDAAWESAVRSTLMIPVRWARAVAGPMAARGWGRILVIESATVKQPAAGMALSNTMRAGATAFLKTLAAELAPKGVTVNTVLPGMYDTERLRALFEFRAKQSGASVEAARDAAVAAVPAGRLGKTAEFGAVVAFLASERASYVTGTALQVDGGMVRGLL